MSGFEEQDKLLGNVGAKKGDGEAQGKGNAVNATGRLRRRWQDELSTRQQRPHEEPDERGEKKRVFEAVRIHMAVKDSCILRIISLFSVLCRTA